MRSALLLLCLLAAGAFADTTPRLLFWTGFEGDLAVEAPRRGECWHNGCWQDVSGRDAATGFTWPPKIRGGAARYQMLSNPVGGGANERNVGEYILNEVQTVEGPRGRRTRAMYSVLHKGGGDATQNPLMLLPGEELPALYVSQWIRLQPDLERHMARGTWRDLFEFKTTDSDYRLELAIVNYGGGALLWQARGDGWVPRYTEYWRIQNRSVPVPAGEWFKLEVYWKRSSGRDGRAWFAVNGKVIADRRGPNMGPNGSRINRVMLNQLYSGGDYPAYQWIDDLQVWSDFPDARPDDPWYDPPYAKHRED